MILSGLFAFYLSLYFLRIHEYRPETAQTNILFVTLAACLIIYLLKKEKNLNTIQTPFLVGFVLAAILSHLTQFYLAGTITTADQLIRLAALYFISASLFIDRERLVFYFKLITVCALMITIHGIDQFHGDGIGWTGVQLFRGVRIRYLGVFNDPNDTGMLLLIAIPFVLYLIKNSTNIISKIFWVSVFPVILYGIYLTGSRGTLLGLIAMILVYSWMKVSKVFTISVGLLALPVSIAYTKLSTISNEDASAAGRVDAWGEGIQMLKSNPFLGVGHGMFKDHHIRAAHSSYVEVFSETGLIGYFFWLGFVMMSAYGLYQFSFKYSLPRSASDMQKKQYLANRSISTTIFFSMVAFMVTAFFISRSIQPILFIICAMSAGLYYQINKAHPDFELLNFRNTFRICMFLTISTVLLVYLVIRLFW